ncbi:MAG: fumarylacetoacetase [Acidimicrobiales bacterium]
MSRWHLPYGSFTLAGSPPRLGILVDDSIADLAGLADAGLIDDSDGALHHPNLDRLLAAGPRRWAELRNRLLELFLRPGSAETQLFPAIAATMLMPWTVADYVDFYSSIDHAQNVGKIFRPDQEPLLPNWRHLPVGYHGRAGTIVVSGTPINRPHGQHKAPGADIPEFGPSSKLDIEAEVGFVVGTPSAMGEVVTTGAFSDYVFGVVLVNDWSARDIQAWEYVPLGPFLGKSFATSVAPWVTPLAALEPARITPPRQDPRPFDYLSDPDPWALDLQVTVSLNGEAVSCPSFADMYWTPGQQLAHLTVNGASLRTGDLFASGTVSGPRSDQWGSLLELTWNGALPLTLSDGSLHTFLLDGDTVELTATAPDPDGYPFSLGSVKGTIVAGRSS